MQQDETVVPVLLPDAPSLRVRAVVFVGADGYLRTATAFDGEGDLGAIDLHPIEGGESYVAHPFAVMPGEKGSGAFLAARYDKAAQALGLASAPQQPSTPLPDADFSYQHLQAALKGSGLTLTKALAGVGMPPLSRDELAPDVILAFFRALVVRAFSIAPAAAPPPPAPADLPAGSPQPTPSLAPGTDGPVAELAGIPREELLLGKKAAFAAMFAELRVRGLTSAPDFEAWVRAENLWPADNRFPDDVRVAIAKAMLGQIESPSKIATGVHEMTPSAV